MSAVRRGPFPGSWRLSAELRARVGGVDTGAAGTASSALSMSDSPATLPFPSAARRALRFWALLDGVYAPAIALLAIFAVPWKSPLFNVAALIRAAALLGGAPFLWRGQRFAHR